MRITAEEKLATRNRILEAARTLFAERGYQAVSTRELAAAADIAAGTLFNYFRTKEALAEALVREALDALSATASATNDAETLDEVLFELGAQVLRALRPCRELIRPVLEAIRNGLPDDEGGGSFRDRHMDLVESAIRRFGKTPGSPFALGHIYWSLFLGVLGFWTQDQSPRQEDTLALLDHSLRLFVISLADRTDQDWRRSHAI